MKGNSVQLEGKCLSVKIRGPGKPWVAILTGLDPTYGFKREWVNSIGSAQMSKESVFAYDLSGIQSGSIINIGYDHGDPDNYWKRYYLYENDTLKTLANSAYQSKERAEEILRGQKV